MSHLMLFMNILLTEAVLSHASICLYYVDSFVYCTYLVAVFNLACTSTWIMKVVDLFIEPYLSPLILGGKSVFYSTRDSLEPCL